MTDRTDRIDRIDGISSIHKIVDGIHYANNVSKSSEQDPPKYITPSGQTSSHRAPHYDSIPASFLRRMGLRFQLGDDTHGRGNRMNTYQPGPCDGSPVRYDIDALRDRYNHAIDHLIALREGTREDDHIGAVAWFLAYASEAEEYGVDWKEVLATRTPVDETSYRLGRGLIPKPTSNLDPNRCAVCGWPLVDGDGVTDRVGCVRGNCSMRPHPMTLYDPVRATSEAKLYGIVDRLQDLRERKTDEAAPVVTRTMPAATHTKCGARCGPRLSPNLWPCTLLAGHEGEHTHIVSSADSADLDMRDKHNGGSVL